LSGAAASLARARADDRAAVDSACGSDRAPHMDVGALDYARGRA